MKSQNNKMSENRKDEHFQNNIKVKAKKKEI